MDDNLSLKALSEIHDMNIVKNEVLFVVDKNNIITDIEASSSNVLGLDSNSMIGNKFASFLIELYEDFSFFDFMLPRDTVILTFKSNQAYIHAEIKYHHISDANNVVTGAYGSIVDISNYIKYKQRLDMMSKLLDNSKDIIYHYETFPEPRFTYISKSLEAVLGHSIEQDYNDPTHIFKITHPEDLKILEQKATGTIDYSKPIVTRWLHNDGHYIWMEDYAIPSYDFMGNLVAVQGICRDISERIKMQERLKLLEEKNIG
jgi:PAS domain S-box-containing protein